MCSKDNISRILDILHSHRVPGKVTDVNNLVICSTRLQPGLHAEKFFSGENLGRTQ
jgi:hypothetical protein